MLEDASGERSGIDLQQQLESYGCWAEMADARYVVFVLGARTGLDDAHALIQALESIAGVGGNARIDGSGGTAAGLIKATGATAIAAEDRKHRRSNTGRDEDGSLQHLVPSEPVLLSRAKRNPVQEEKIALNEAVGRVAAERMTPYPPGIPILFEGERISSEVVQQINELLRAGARFQGMDAADRGSIVVRKEG